MAKKRKEKDLVMHKLLGDHAMVNTSICPECGIREGDKVIEPYVPVTMSADQVFELLKTVKELAERVKSLQQDMQQLRVQGEMKQVGKPWEAWKDAASPKREWGFSGSQIVSTGATAGSALPTIDKYAELQSILHEKNTTTDKT